MLFAFKVIVSAMLISFASWLSGRLPTLAGFIVALPLATLIVLPMSWIENGDREATFVFARSVFVAVPVSLAFFLPFLLAPRLQLGFWTAYGTGILCLVAAFFLHRFLATWLFAPGA